MPTASNLASTTAGASKKKKTPAKPSVSKQKSIQKSSNCQQKANKKAIEII